MDEVADLARKMESAGVTYEIQVYSGPPHGFTEFNSERYQKRADEQSWDAFVSGFDGVFDEISRVQSWRSCDLAGYAASFILGKHLSHVALFRFSRVEVARLEVSIS